MSDTKPHDKYWQIALDWVMREHDGSLSESDRAELQQWLAGSPEHCSAYEEANRVWLITGLVPPATDTE